MQMASRALLAFLCTLLAASGAYAVRSWQTEIEQAAALPPLQAVVALARMAPDDAKAKSSLEHAYTAALRRLGEARRRSLGPQLEAVHQDRIHAGPKGTPHVTSTDAWQAPLYPSPDGQLVALRTDQGLEIRTVAGDLVCRLAPSAEMQRHMPVRFSGPRLTPGIPAWSHDGVQIACSMDGLMCVFPLGAPPREVSDVTDMLKGAAGREGLWDDDPIWSADDHLLLFSRWERDAAGHLLEPRTVRTDAVRNGAVVLGQGSAIDFYRGDTTQAISQLGGTLSILTGDLTALTAPSHVSTGAVAAA
ncbi:MAG: hypothetical protein ACYCW6_27975, partial [Candidatus Xenobia bacterium]